MPQLDSSTYVGQIFWLLLTFVPLYLILWKVALPRIASVLEQRQEKIEDDLVRAEKLKVEAAAILADYNKALEEARGRAVAALKVASDEMAAAAEERSEALNSKLAARLKDAEAKITTAKEAALASIKPVAVEAASAASAKLIGAAIASDKVESAVAKAFADSA